jgi:hypothetical protein
MHLLFAIQSKSLQLTSECMLFSSRTGRNHLSARETIQWASVSLVSIQTTTTTVDAGDGQRHGRYALVVPIDSREKNSRL